VQEIDRDSLRFLHNKKAVLRMTVQVGASLSGTLRAKLVYSVGAVADTEQFHNGYTGSVDAIDLNIAAGGGAYYAISAAVIPSGTLNAAVVFVHDPSGTAGDALDYFDVKEVLLTPADALTAEPPFVHAGGDYITELALCQAYYEKSYNLAVVPGTNTAVGVEFVGCTSGGDPVCNVKYKVRKCNQNAIVLAFWTTAGVAGTWQHTGGTTGINSLNSSEQGFTADATGSPDTTVGEQRMWGHWSSEAEFY
jgi:hypothetical protein